MSVMNGCHDARNAVSIEEISCPHCGNPTEAFIRDESLAIEFRCDRCRYAVSAGETLPQHKEV